MEKKQKKVRHQFSDIFLGPHDRVCEWDVTNSLNCATEEVIYTLLRQWVLWHS